MEMEASKNFKPTKPKQSKAKTKANKRSQVNLWLNDA